MFNSENLIMRKRYGEIHYEDLTEEKVDEIKRGFTTICFGCANYFNCPKFKDNSSVMEMDFVNFGVTAIKDNEVDFTYVSDCNNYEHSYSNPNPLSYQNRIDLLEELALHLRPAAKDLDDALLAMVHDENNTLLDDLHKDVRETNKCKTLTKMTNINRF